MCPDAKEYNTATHTCECPSGMRQNAVGEACMAISCDNGQIWNDLTQVCECGPDMTMDTQGVCVRIDTDVLNGCDAGSGKYWHSHDVGCICQERMRTDTTNGTCVADTLGPNEQQICSGGKYWHSNEEWCICPPNMKEDANGQCVNDPRPRPSSTN